MERIQSILLLLLCCFSLAAQQKSNPVLYAGFMLTGGAFGEKQYFGLGITMGMGYHKKYQYTKKFV